MGKKYILGLDIGIASVGAALLGCDDAGHPQNIHALHVRTFDKAETAKEGESLNKIRRDARLMRRTVRRRKHRKERLRGLLKREGLINFLDPALLKTEKSPWQLRSEALDRRLSDLELAVMLYHIVGHRNFQSNRKSEALNAEMGKMLGEVSDNSRRMELGGYRTIGEMVWKDKYFAEAKRNKRESYKATFARADIESELHKIFDSQREFGSLKAGEEFEEIVYEILMARRPALSGEALLKMVGRCTFEPNEYRAPKSCYTAEYFVWLTKLNNLRIAGIGAQRAITDEERYQLIRLPYKYKKVTYKQLRNALALEEGEKFVGLDYSGMNKPENSTLFEAKAYHGLQKVYKDAGLETAWEQDKEDAPKLDLLGYAQTVFKEDDEARIWLQEKGVETEIIEAVLHISFSQFLHLSLAALRKINPMMEKGLRYDEAALDSSNKCNSFSSEDFQRSQAS